MDVTGPISNGEVLMISLWCFVGLVAMVLACWDSGQ